MSVRDGADALADLVAPTMSAAERYHDEHLLGEGGMGEVRLHHDAWIGRHVATKRLLHGPDASPFAQLRFLREARVQGQIEHPSVVPVYDLGVGADGGLFFTMRRVRGRTLSDVLDALADGDPHTSQQFSGRKLLTAFVNVCLAVHYAHARGVVHRDIKPGNIMFGDFGEVYILDWGIAKVTGLAEIESEAVQIEDGVRTQAGSLVGTPAYMSPEQVRGAVDEVDARSDVYSLGLILYELLTYRQAHERASAATIFANTLDGLDLRPTLDAKETPPELTAIVERATATNSAERFESARALADVVERYLDGDRDLARRRELARTHAEQAEQQADLALSDSATAVQAQAARAEALRRVMQALALDPQESVARRTLVRLMVESGGHMPAEVVEQMERSESDTQRFGMRIGFWVHLSWLSCIPLVALMGVRSWVPILVTSFFTCVVTAITFTLREREGLRPIHGAILAGGHFLTVMSVTHWLGPFVFVPCAVAVGTIIFSIMTPRRDRPMYMLIGVLAGVLPYVLEWLHVVPRAYEFHSDRIVLFARSIEFGSWKTQAGLIYLGLMYTVVPAWYFGRVRDALSAAEGERFLQAWHLNKLLEASNSDLDTTARIRPIAQGAPSAVG